MKKFLRNIIEEMPMIIGTVLTVVIIGFLIWINTGSYNNITKAQVLNQIQNFGYSNIQLGTMKHEVIGTGRCRPDKIASVDFKAVIQSDKTIDDLYACIGIAWKMGGNIKISIHHK